MREQHGRETDADRLNAALIEAAKGSKDALRRVYELTSPKLFGVCLRLLGEHGAAEDALQQVYLRVWQRAAAFDPARASAMTWLLLITRGIAIDELRASGRRRRESDALVDRPIVEESHDVEDRRAIEQCIELLEAEPRAAILAAFFDGYTYDELAQRSETPLGTIKSRIRRALLTLKRCLDDA